MYTSSSFKARFSRRSGRGIFPVLLPLLAAVLVPVLRVSVARGAPLLQNTLSLGTASGPSGTDVIVPLKLANQDAVGGIQLDVVFDSTAVRFTGVATTPRATGMSIGSSTLSAGRLRVLMYFGLGGSIAAGTGGIADLTFHLIGTVGTALAPDSTELSDPTGQRLSVTATAGEITVTGGTDTTGACCASSGTCTVTTEAGCAAPNVWQGAGTRCTPDSCPLPPAVDTLSLGVRSGASGAEVTVPLALRNTRAVGGIQLDILFDPAVVSFRRAVITSRATGMLIPTSTPTAGSLRVVMYSMDGDSIAAGDGAVADLTFRVIGAEGVGCDLTPDAVTLSDPYAQALPVTASAGHITVIGGGDPTGACCAPAGTCMLVTQSGCTAGTWQGVGTACIPNLCPPAGAADTLAVGVGSGAIGTEVTVPLSLWSTQSVKALQLDIRFTASVVSWVSGAAAPRVAGMAFVAQPQGADGVRIVMYYADTTTVAPGNGAISNLVFRLGGASGTSSPLALSGVVVADPEGRPVTVTNRDGRLDVTSGPGAPPDLRLAVLKNPGRTRTLQVFVSSDVALDASPTVHLSGGVAVPLTRLPGVNLFQGSVSVDDGTVSVTVQATGIHDGVTGAAQSTVTF